MAAQPAFPPVTRSDITHAFQCGSLNRMALLRQDTESLFTAALFHYQNTCRGPIPQ
jgi:hypothetical protein